MRRNDITREEEIIKHIKEYIESGMWKYEACDLSKEDLELIIKALEYESKTGHWITCDVLQEVKCSECRACFRYTTNYCPNCGAKMESEG